MSRGKRLIFGICSCKHVFYDAISMNYHPQGDYFGVYHQWVEVPDIRIVKEMTCHVRGSRGSIIQWENPRRASSTLKKSK